MRAAVASAINEWMVVLCTLVSCLLSELRNHAEYTVSHECISIHLFFTNEKKSEYASNVSGLKIAYRPQAEGRVVSLVI